MRCVVCIEMFIKRGEYGDLYQIVDIVRIVGMVKEGYGKRNVRQHGSRIWLTRIRSREKLMRGRL